MRDWNSIVREHVAVVAALAEQGTLLDRIAGMLVRTFREGGRVYIVGNGGSAADAQHIAGELLGRFKRERPALPAIALTTDTSTLTAIANDYAFDRVFVRQVEALIEPGDVLWALSTSGNSPNIVQAAKIAKDCRAAVIGFTGQSGGQLNALCDECLCVPHASSDRIQEGHQLAYHYVCERVEAAFAQQT
jgi:D-sedoheptulose 7-phosphate isomerase